MTYTEMVLLLLLVSSNAFWAWQAHKLINKMLSRSYYEYKQAEKVGARKVVGPQAVEPPPDRTALNSLEQLAKQFSPFA